MKAGWVVKPLAKVCEVFADGDWVESKDQSLEGIRLIQTGNVGEGVFKDRAEKARYISEDTFKRLRCTAIFENDCLISRLPDPVGRSCLLPDTGERMITAVDCTIVRFDRKQCLPTFFNYYSQSHYYLKIVASKCTGTTRSRISRSNLSLIPIPVPPLPEQRRIVAILDETFDGIATAKANAEKNLQNARALFESHLQSVFTERGDGWVEKSLGECFRLKSGDGLTSKAMNAGAYPVFGGNGIAGMHNEFNLSGDNVIIGRVGALCGNARHIAENIWLTDNAFKIVDFNCEFDGAFLTYLLNYKNLRSLARQAAQPVISNSSLKDLLLNFPGLLEQQRITRQLDALSKETQRLESLYQQKLTALDALKKSLLHQAFSGQL